VSNLNNNDLSANEEKPPFPAGGHSPENGSEGLSDSSSGEIFPAKAPKRKKFRFFIYALLFLLLMVIGAALALGIWVRQFYTPIRVEEATPVRLAGWAVLRDLDEVEPQVQQQLAEKYFEPIREDMEVDFESEEAKKILSYTKPVAEKRDAELAQWGKEQPAKKFLRREYRAKKPDQGAIRSSDVTPTDDLKKEYDALKSSGKTRVPPARTTPEKNIRTIIKNWFIYQIQQYDAAPDDRKAAQINSTADQLLRLQKIYNQYREAAGLKPLTQIEQLREFDFMSASWFDSTEIDELARLLWFKDLIVTVLIAKQSGSEPDIEKLIFKSSSGLLHGLFGS